MDSIIAQIQALAQSTDDAGRLNIEKALRKAQIEIKSPADLVMEFGNSVSGCDSY